MQIVMILDYFPMDMTLGQVFATKRNIFILSIFYTQRNLFAKSSCFEVSLSADGRRYVHTKFFYSPNSPCSSIIFYKLAVICP